MPAKSQNTIGARLREWRKLRNLSVGELAEQSGVDVGTISRTENDHTQITLGKSIELCTALGIELTELARGRQPWMPKDAERWAAVYDFHYLDQVSECDVKAILDLYGHDASSVYMLLRDWLKEIAEKQETRDFGMSPIELDDELIQLFLAKHSLFRLKIRYPAGLMLWALPTIHKFGGAIGHGELKLFLSAAANTPLLYQHLDRQDKDVLMRLRGDTLDGIRVSDVVKFGEELNVDLVDMYWKAEKAETGGEREGDGTEEDTKKKARLITIFVAICCWFESISEPSDHWLEEKIRQKLNAKRGEIVHG